MNQADMINAISKDVNNTGTTKAAIKFVLEAQARAAEAALKKGDDVALAGLGKLSIKVSAARKGRNPATGAEIDIPAKKKPAFSAAKSLKDAVA